MGIFPSSLCTVSLWSSEHMVVVPKNAYLPGRGPADSTYCQGPRGFREWEGVTEQVLEGLHPTLLIRESVVGQTPLFIELSLLKGVCAIFFVGGGVGRWGVVVSAKGCLWREGLWMAHGEPGQAKQTALTCQNQ